tara:strand:- start:5 stop:214 length:210 start_codon:yes stop_codon:yes gene_type:complete
MKKLLLSLGAIAIFGIGATTNSLNIFDNSETMENNISKINDKKLSDSENENISQEINIESSCCPKILNN